MREVETFLALSPTQKQRTILRSDGGFGSDANINAVLASDWQILTKNKGGLRPQAFARQIAETQWQDLGQARWVAPVAQPIVYVRPTQSLLLRWLTEQQRTKYAIVVCSVVDWTPAQVIAAYDQRGACETEIQADKMGLRLERRRKKQLTAQSALVLLNDLAHNLLAWTRAWMFPPEDFAQYGALRLVEDVLCIPGRLRFDGARLVEVQLNERHPHARRVALALERLLAHFEYP